MSIKIITGAALALFTFIFSTVLMFGLLDTTTGSLVVFKALFFTMSFMIAGIIFYYNMHKIDGVPLRVMMFFAIILFCLSLGSFAGAVKDNHDLQVHLGQQNIEALEQQTESYAKYAESLSSYLISINSEEATILEEIDNIQNKLDNREPIIVENVVVIPGEITYVEEYYDAEDNYENDKHEDDEHEDDEHED